MTKAIAGSSDVRTIEPLPEEKLSIKVEDDICIYEFAISLNKPSFDEQFLKLDVEIVKVEGNAKSILSIGLIRTRLPVLFKNVESFNVKIFKFWFNLKKDPNFTEQFEIARFSILICKNLALNPSTAIKLDLPNSYVEVTFT